MLISTPLVNITWHINQSCVNSCRWGRGCPLSPKGVPLSLNMNNNSINNIKINQININQININQININGQKEISNAFGREVSCFQTTTTSRLIICFFMTKENNIVKFNFYKINADFTNALTSTINSNIDDTNLFLNMHST